MQNNLILRRLVIYSNNGKIAYDEHFKSGVNIICGDNSSGKSTITHFIFFALGGEFSSFVPEARECQSVYAEIESNGSILTLKRDIIISERTNKINPRVAIQIYWGTYEESINPPPNKYWERYEYNTTDNKKSFSNILFEILGLPEVKEENNISMHQILRLLYIDQESPTSSLFYYDEFDKQATREAIADLLLGIYNQDLYDYKLALFKANKDLEEVKSDIRVTKRFFPNPLYLNKEHIFTLIENKEKDIVNIEEKIISIRSKIVETNYSLNDELEFQKIQNEAIQQRKVVADLTYAKTSLLREIQDSEYFIESLQDKYRALENSINTRDFLGNLTLDYCPECLNKLNIVSDDVNCKLCKQVTDDKLGVKTAKRMQLEIKFQIDESSKLLKIRNENIAKLVINEEIEKTKLFHIQEKVNSSIKDVKPFEIEQLDRLNYEKGVAEGEISQFRTILEQAEIFNKLLQERDDLNSKIEKYVSSIEAIKYQQKEIKKTVLRKIQEEGVYLLNNDFDRQKEFKNASPKDLVIDFSNNLVYLKSADTEQNKMYQKFSASSNFYLKVSARFAIFLASIGNNIMRYPRFIFADNMEDKGIEIKRAQNLQKLLIDRVEKYDQRNYQLIYTTSYITDELKNSDYVVGEYYTILNPSLKNLK